MRRIGAAAVGGAVGAAAVTMAAGASSWRPAGWWVAATIVLVAVPALVAAGTWVAVRLVDRHAPAWATARLAAVGTPVLALFTQFIVVAAAGPSAMGVQQAVSLVVGAAVAAALAARFTPAEAEPGS